MPWNSSTVAGIRIDPPRMSFTFTNKVASMLFKITDQLFKFHTAICTSSYSSSRCCSASSASNSNASSNVIFNVSSNSSRVLSWQFTPDISRIQPIHPFTTVLNLSRIGAFHLFPPYDKIIPLSIGIVKPFPNRTNNLSPHGKCGSLTAPNTQKII